MADELAFISLLIAIAAFLFAIRDHIEKIFFTRQSIYESYSKKVQMIEQEFKQFAAKKFLEFAQTISFPEDEISEEWIQKEYPQIKDKIDEIYKIAEGTTTPKDYLSILRKNREDLLQRVLKWIIYIVGLLIIIYIISLNFDYVYGEDPEEILHVSSFFVAILVLYVCYGGLMISLTFDEYKKARSSLRRLEKLIEAYDFKKDELPDLIIEFTEELYDFL